MNILLNLLSRLIWKTPKQTIEQRYDSTTAIEKRDLVITELVNKLSNSVDTDSKQMKHLTIVAIRDEDDDATKFDWTGEEFEENLKIRLANTGLANVGCESLKIVFETKTEAKAEHCHELIKDRVYYQWGKANATQPNAPAVAERLVAYISIVKDTGSMMEDTYTLDSKEKQRYNIGRGKGIHPNYNDIIIKNQDNETNADIYNRNSVVANNHAYILLNNNRFWLKVYRGGCRGDGGNSTKVFHGNNQGYEMNNTDIPYFLEDGDVIELSNCVRLRFSLQNPL